VTYPAPEEGRGKGKNKLAAGKEKVLILGEKSFSHRRYRGKGGRGQKKKCPGQAKGSKSGLKRCA